jgi:ABC-type glycerol-3-phosphate transport system permease component
MLTHERKPHNNPFKVWARDLRHTSPLYVVLFIVLFLYAFLMIYLIGWGVLTSLKSQEDFRTNVLGWPRSFEWGNFQNVLKNFYVNISVAGVPSKVYMEKMLLYTVLYAGGGALVSTAVPCFVAYACSHFHYRFNKVILAIVIVTMILPIVGSAPAEISLLRSFGMYDTIWGSWIQKFHFLGAYFLVFLAAFQGVSKEYSEAAYIDGAGEFTTMMRINFPLVRNAFTTVLLIKFIDFWNDYQTPLLYLPSHPTLATGVYSLSFTSINSMNTVPMRMAGCVILMVPILVLFIAFRKKIMGNITLGGIKE